MSHAQPTTKRNRIGGPLATIQEDSSDAEIQDLGNRSNSDRSDDETHDNSAESPDNSAETSAPSTSGPKRGQKLRREHNLWPPSHLKSRQREVQRDLRCQSQRLPRAPVARMRPGTLQRKKATLRGRPRPLYGKLRKKTPLPQKTMTNDFFAKEVWKLWSNGCWLH